MTIFEKAKMINKEITNKGFKSFLVGGCVRDEILGLDPKDFDIASNVSVEVLMELFGEENVVGIGLTSLDIGVVGVKIDGDMFEVARFRAEAYTEEGGRIPTTNFVEDIDGDLSRRDFTINAMAFDTTGTDIKELKDPFNGLSDISNKVIRAVGNPMDRFNEDPLRILRGVRFASRFGFDIEPATRKAMCKSIQKLKTLSQERITMEIEKILMSDNPKLGFETLQEIGALQIILPELSRTFGFDQNSKWHSFTLEGHILTAVERSAKIREVRLALLFHDIAKQDCQTTDEEGDSHFFGHDVESAKMAQEILTRMKLNKKTIKIVCSLIRSHMVRFNDFGNKGMRKLVDKIGEENIEMLFEVWLGDEKGHSEIDESGMKTTFEKMDRVRNFINAPVNIRIKDLAINGRDIRELFKDNPKQIGIALKTSLSAVLDGDIVNEKEKLIDFVKNM